MSRLTDSTNIAEIAKTGVTLLIFADLDFSSGHQYVHNGVGTITWGGHDWLGVGTLGQIDPISEGIKDISRSMKLSLSGVDSSLVGVSMNEIIVERKVTLYAGFVDQQAGTVIATPESIGGGYIDAPQVVIGKTCTISFVLENESQRETRIARYTSEDQKLIDPTDTYFDQMANISTTVSVWGMDPAKNWGEMVMRFAKDPSGL